MKSVTLLKKEIVMSGHKNRGGGGSGGEGGEGGSGGGGNG